VKHISLNKKPLDRKDESMPINIARPSLLFKNINEPQYEEHIISSDEVGRIDLIALKFYGNHDHVDTILKFNNIINPFAPMSGDVIKIPFRTIATKSWKDISKVDILDNPVLQQFLDTKRLTKKDAKRIKWLKKKSDIKVNGSDNPLPPNMLQPGDTNIDVGNGVITI
tara:strand:+ start:274 stop:777 length:504 start_codon:yes stop_codon:yes gene_type:complete